MTINKSSASNCIRVAVGVAALSVIPFAQAEYRLSVFDNARAHDALTRSDLAGAAIAFEKPAIDPMGYADNNNLCVMQIVQRDTLDAVRNCRVALKQIQSKSIRQRDKRKMRSVVLSNLSVAMVLNGDYNAAEATIERAMALDNANKEAVLNRKLYAQTKVASN